SGSAPWLLASPAPMPRRQRGAREPGKNEHRDGAWGSNEKEPYPPVQKAWERLVQTPYRSFEDSPLRSGASFYDKSAIGQRRKRGLSGGSADKGQRVSCRMRPAD